MPEPHAANSGLPVTSTFDLYMRILLVFIVAWSLIRIVCGETSDSHFDKIAHLRLEALATNQTDVHWMQSVTNLPKSIQQSLGSIADVGQLFSMTCSGSGAHKRFLCATKQGTTYNVALEQGGRAYFWYAVQYLLDEKGRIIRETKIEQNGTLNNPQRGSFKEDKR